MWAPNEGGVEAHTQEARMDPQPEIAAPIRRWAALGGVAFVALFVIGALLMFAGAPEGNDPPAEFRS